MAGRAGSGASSSSGGGIVSPGNALLLVAALHSFVVAALRPQLWRGTVGLLSSFGAMGDSASDDIKIAYWYHVAGLMYASLGCLVNLYEARGRLPAAAGYASIASSAMVLVVAPASGFWVGLPLGAWIVARADSNKDKAG